MPAVCSNSVRRRLVSVVPKRSAMPGQIPDRIDGDLDHGQAAARLHHRAVVGEPARRHRLLHLARGRAARASRRCWGGCRCPRRSPARRLRRPCGPTDRARRWSCAPTHCGNGPMAAAGCVLVRSGPPDRIERAGGDGERPVDRIGAAMRADDVAVLRPRHRADDGSALARRRRAPGNGKARLGARRRMRGEANMVGAVRTAHDRCPKMPTARRSGGPTPTAVIDAAASTRVPTMPTERHYSCIPSGNKAQDTM